MGLAVVALSRALVYLPLIETRREVPAAILALSVGTPITITGWGVLWAVTGVALVLAGWMRRRFQQWAMGMMVFMLAWTAAAYMYSWLLLFPPDNGEWSGGALYTGYTIALVALVRQDKRLLPPPPKGNQK